MNLFLNEKLDDFLQILEKNFKNEINDFEDNYILNVDQNEIIKYLINKYQIEIIKLDFDCINWEVSNNDIKINIPYSGNKELLQKKPFCKYILGFYTEFEINDNEIACFIKYEKENQEILLIKIEEIKKYFKHNIKEIMEPH
ncbi:hypothetical protein [Spiroplasma phoeniceum]|uniref:Uncharacterized protein n=1 Tax=Spiroplasma phoeniceum P40 TaxID=1276259 RepID=A0A345DLX8_9MOLU|nr:hypothetical protein [Spiroplasma phoeniceum]AXF95216.1 hypothetical protein SDAV_00221 [Spiroplasma phoeniceum P40]